MDDILIFSKKNTHQQDIEDLLDILIEYRLCISPHKCQMFRDRLVYMGLHFMIKEGKPCFEPMKDKCDVIRNMQPLCTVKECRKFCGMVNFLSTFLPKLHKYLIPIYALTKKKATFKWTEEWQKSFGIIKKCLQKPPVLRMPAGNGIFHLESDTSREAAGGTLYQWKDEQWALIGYHSKRLPDVVFNYGVCEPELMGLVCNIHGFKHLLKDNYFEIIIDHKAIEYLNRTKYQPTTRRLGSLLLKLQDYAFDIKYLEGAKLKASDAVSWLYIEEKHKITDVIPLNFLLHTAEPFIHLQYIDSTNELYAHKAINTKIRSRQDSGVKCQKKQPAPAGPIVPTVKQHDKSCVTVKSKSRKTTKDDNPPQIQDIVALSSQRMQETITNNLINPDLKTLFDVNSNKEVITSI